MAVFRGQLEAVRLLLAAGADPGSVGAEGDSPLRFAVERGARDLAELLLRAGADRTIDGAGGPSGMSALGRAAFDLEVAMIDLLLRHGARPDALDAGRRTARDHMPARTVSNLDAWDAAAQRLGQPSGTAANDPVRAVATGVPSELNAALRCRGWQISPGVAANGRILRAAAPDNRGTRGARGPARR
jgi:ankyrin repeat protein